MNDVCKLAHPLCQFLGWEKLHPGCEQGILPDGGSCDCSRANVYGFEDWGCSHRVAVLVNASLDFADWFEWGLPNEYQVPVNTLLEIIESNAWPNDQHAADLLTKWCKDFPYFAGYAAGSTGSYLYL